MLVLPDYKKSIVNLMSSIGEGFGVKSSYKPLEILKTKELKKAKRVVLLVIDGLGAEFVKEKASKESIFVKNKIEEITSVFPSTTTSAITTFLTGMAPKEHGLTAWHMNVKELGGIVRVLPWEKRGGGKIKAKLKEVLQEEAFLEKIKAKTVCVAPQEIRGAEFNRRFTRKAKQLSFKSLKGMFYQINKAIKSRGKRKFIYAYWPRFDELAHGYGTESRKVGKHFKEIEKELGNFVKRIKGRGVVLLVTADHGVIDGEGVNLNEHKEFMDCLSVGVCGEARAAFCYVKPGKVKEFESYVKEKLGEYCEMFKSEELVEKGWFGLGKKHERLLDRIGDYVLIAKKNYGLRDFLAGEKAGFFKANHGGLSREEMIVPLLYINSSSTSNWS